MKVCSVSDTIIKAFVRIFPKETKKNSKKLQKWLRKKIITIDRLEFCEMKS